MTEQTSAVRPAAALQYGVGHDDDHAVRRHDDKGRNAEFYDLSDQPQACPAERKADLRAFQQQEHRDEQKGQKLREHRGERRARHVHAEYEDKEGIERDICRRADDGREHPHA